jgi:hypothetical protein
MRMFGKFFVHILFLGTCEYSVGKNQLKIRKSKKDITILVTIETRTPVSPKGSYTVCPFFYTYTYNITVQSIMNILVSFFLEKFFRIF